MENDYKFPTHCPIDGSTLVYQRNRSEAYCQVHHEVIGEVQDDWLSYYKWFRDELEIIDCDLEDHVKFKKFMLGAALWRDLDRKIR